MIIALIKRLEGSKYTRWIAVAAFILLISAVALEGKLTRTVWLLLIVFSVFGSAFAGLIIGKTLAQMIKNHLLKQSAELASHLAPALSCFGFLFLPAIIVTLVNKFLGTNIQMQSLGAHFMWACVVGGLVFMAGSAEQDR